MVDDDWFPLPPEEHERQVLALVRALAPVNTRTIIDLGAGNGRIARPLRAMGARVVAVDSDPAALEACASLGVVTMRADLTDPALALDRCGVSRFDAALCLGHTFLLMHRPAWALSLLGAVRKVLPPGGAMIIDNCCSAMWAEVASGNWQTGISEDGAMQMLWADGDNVVALRRGPDIRPDDWDIDDRAGDRLLRVWSRGELSLLAAAAGFTGPVEDSPDGALLLFRSAPG